MSDRVKFALDKPKNQNLPCRNNCGDTKSKQQHIFFDFLLIK